MNSPLIKQWELRPPVGGWSVTYYEGDQEFFCDAKIPREAVRQIREIQKINGTYKGDEAIWDYCNEVWCENDPARCAKKAEHKLSPTDFGRPLWAWLHTFGMKFDKEQWHNAIIRIGQLLNPESHDGGCEECYSEWQSILKETPPKASNEIEASKWSWAAHERVNRKIGKPSTSYKEAAKLHHWKS